MHRQHLLLARECLMHVSSTLSGLIAARVPTRSRPALALCSWSRPPDHGISKSKMRSASKVMAIVTTYMYTLSNYPCETAMDELYGIHCLHLKLTGKDVKAGGAGEGPYRSAILSQIPLSTCTGIPTLQKLNRWLLSRRQVWLAHMHLSLHQVVNLERLSRPQEPVDASQPRLKGAGDGSRVTLDVCAWACQTDTYCCRTSKSRGAETSLTAYVMACDMSLRPFCKLLIKPSHTTASVAPDQATFD